MQDWFGWVLFLLSFVLLSNKEFRENKRTFVVIYFSLLARNFLNVYISFFNPNMIIGPDPLGFHDTARALMNAPEFGFQTVLFSSLISVFYRIFGVSFFMGNELCILVYIGSCFVFMKILKALNLSRYQTFLIFLYAFLPDMVAWTSVEMREVFEIFFFMLAFLEGIYYLRSPSYGRALAVVALSIAFGVFHFALLGFSIVFSLLTLVWPFLKLPKPNRVILVFGIVAMCVLGFLGASLFFSKLHLGELALLIAVAKHPSGFFMYAEKFREGMASAGGRTAYQANLDLSSAHGSATSSLVLLIYFIFAPFPWQVSSAPDAVAFCESALRLMLILFAFREWRKASGEKRTFYSLFLLAYFVMSFMWSLGVTNFGTSARHNITNYWVLVLLGGPALARFLESLAIKDRRDQHVWDYRLS